MSLGAIVFSILRAFSVMQPVQGGVYVPWGHRFQHTPGVLKTKRSATQFRFGLRLGKLTGFAPLSLSIPLKHGV